MRSLSYGSTRGPHSLLSFCLSPFRSLSLFSFFFLSPPLLSTYYLNSLLLPFLPPATPSPLHPLPLPSYNARFLSSILTASLTTNKRRKMWLKWLSLSYIINGILCVCLARTQRIIFFFFLFALLSVLFNYVTVLHCAILCCITCVRFVRGRRSLCIVIIIVESMRYKYFNVFRWVFEYMTRFLKHDRSWM